MSYFFSALVALFVALVALSISNPTLLLPVPFFVISTGRFKRGLFISFSAGIFFSLFSLAQGVYALGALSLILLVFSFAFSVAHLSLSSRNLASLLWGTVLLVVFSFLLSHRLVWKDVLGGLVIFYSALFLAKRFHLEGEDHPSL